jgi:hypothetical protein
MSIDGLLTCIDRAVAGWDRRETRFRAGVERELAVETGYHPAMVAAALDDVARAFRRPALERLLRRELGAPDVLDRFVRRPGGRMERAYGPGLVAVALSGNVFHVAAESLVLALLTKSACIVKASSRDRLFPVLFARSLAAHDARIAAALAVAWWPGGETAFEDAVYGVAGAVVAYGGEEAVAGVRARTPPDARFVAHGPKVSFAVVTRGHAGRPAVARAAAHDVSFFDQQGCVSPHTIYVEGDTDEALAFARRLAPAMAREQGRTPRGPLAPEEASAVQQARGAAEFRPGAEVFASPGGSAWTVIFDPDPAFAVSCLNRVVYVKPLAGRDALPGLLAPVRAYLQTAGVAGDAAARAAVAAIVGPLGVVRVCALGRMQHPPADWRHDGRPRLLDLLRWTEIEAARG